MLFGAMHVEPEYLVDGCASPVHGQAPIMDRRPCAISSHDVNYQALDQQLLQVVALGV